MKTEDLLIEISNKIKSEYSQRIIKIIANSIIVDSDKDIINDWLEKINNKLN